MQTIRPAAVAAATLLWAATALAVDGTCTITKLDNPSAFLGSTAVFPLPQCVPTDIDFTLDETTGAFTLSEKKWHDRFGDQGCEYRTPAGSAIISYLIWFDHSTAGTIDAAGNVFLPDWQTATLTGFAPEAGNLTPTGLNLFTGPSFMVLQNKPYVIEGAKLDVGTKTVRIAGYGFLADAPGAGGDTLSGLDMTCVLNPAPDASKLPKAPSLKKPAGKVKSGGDAGDRLTLKTTLVPGATPPTVDGSQPFILRLGPLDLVVRSGNFTKKGKHLVAARDDSCKVKKGQTSGTCKANPSTTCSTFADCETTTEQLEVVKGRKESSSAKAEIAGALTLVDKGKKGVAIGLKLAGLDLSTLASGPLRLAIGSQTASADVTVSGGKIK